MNSYSINPQVDTLLDELNATDWLRINLFEVTRNPMFDTYSNQIENALEIAIELKKGEKNLAFLAPMQSGKTGTINALCNYILPSIGYLGELQNVIFLTSMRDTDLYNQNVQTLQDMQLYDFVSKTSFKSRIYVFKIDKFFQKPDPQRIVEQANIKLVIRDEDQYGSGEESTFDIGFFGILREELPNMPLVSVSATPFDSLEAAEHRDDIQIIEGVRPPNYFGISEMLQLGLVEDNDQFQPLIKKVNNYGLEYTLTRTMLEYMSHLESFDSGLGIIRVTKLAEGEILREVVQAIYQNQITPILIGCNNSVCDYDIKEGISKVEQHVCREGRRILLIVVNALSAGKDMRELKVKTRFCIEMRSKQIANAVQGLPGRLCGYHNNRDIKIMAKKDILEHYAEFENDHEKFYDKNWRKNLAEIGIYQISTQVGLTWAERTGKKCKVKKSQILTLTELKDVSNWKYLPTQLFSDPKAMERLFELFEPHFYNNPQRGFKLHIPDVNVRISTNYSNPNDNRVVKLWDKSNPGDDYYSITFMKKDYEAALLISNLPENHPKNKLGFQGIKIVWPEEPYISSGVTETTNNSMYR